MPRYRYTNEQRSLAAELCKRGLNSFLIGRLIGMRPDSVRAIKAGRVKVANWTKIPKAITSTAISAIEQSS